MGRKKKPSPSNGGDVGPSTNHVLDVKTREKHSPAGAGIGTFEAACAKIQENTQRHLERLKQMVDEEDSDEDVATDLQGDQILSKLKQSYDGETQDTITQALLAG